MGCAMANDRSPNWSKWRLIPAVNLWQAVALSLSIDPDQVESNYSWKADATFFDESSEFRDRLEVLKSNLGESQLLSPLSISLADPFGATLRLGLFAEWARSVGWTIPPELATLIPIRSGASTLDESAFSLWTKRQLWTLVEASSLLAGEIPGSDSLNTINYGSSDPARTPLPVGKAAYIYAELKDAIDLERLPFKESRNNELATRRVEPRKCVQWADEFGLDIPEPLRVLLIPMPEPECDVSSARPSLDDREKSALMNTIGALLKMLLEPQPLAGGKARAAFPSQSKIIDALLAEHASRYGMSKRNLESIFAAANRAIESDE